MDSYLIFIRGEKEFAVNLEQVRRVASIREVQSLQSPAPDVLGVVPDGNHIVPVIVTPLPRLEKNDAKVPEVNAQARSRDSSPQGKATDSSPQKGRSQATDSSLQKGRSQAADSTRLSWEGVRPRVLLVDNGERPFGFEVEALEGPLLADCETSEGFRGLEGVMPKELLREVITGVIRKQKKAGAEESRPEMVPVIEPGRLYRARSREMVS